MKESSDRIEKILVILLLQSLKGTPVKEKALWLNRAGFSNIEVADFLETTSQVVANAISEGKKKRRKTAKK